MPRTGGDFTDSIALVSTPVHSTPNMQIVEQKLQNIRVFDFYRGRK